MQLFSFANGFGPPTNSCLSSLAHQWFGTVDDRFPVGSFLHERDLPASGLSPLSGSYCLNANATAFFPFIRSSSPSVAIVVAPGLRLTSFKSVPPFNR